LSIPIKNGPGFALPGLPLLDRPEGNCRAIRRIVHNDIWGGVLWVLKIKVAVNSIRLLPLAACDWEKINGGLVKIRGFFLWLCGEIIGNWVGMR